ncbi:alpha/beta fold hydrolase [Ahrensia sp. R2A130]|uniref:alpha/beta fold hydrolase n=1 Tax=Ahrensia sp. R2A130 TaxID=744979 RepID=UPI0001E0AD06|nr:alpha/beta hydrolase [Ahrensia sp. R2A130]EFL87769.1 hydrolase, alpha/beta fold family [Ahrensia sp. R2A130]
MPHRKKQPAKAYSKHYHLGLGFHGFHRINYLEWGNAQDFSHQETLFCVHGLTRNARDFDFFANRMCDMYRIVCPDVVGRGDSDHIPEDGYNYLQYNADMNSLISRLNVTEVNWIGTSMGGIIGMVLASVAQSPIKRLVINDIGPEVSREAQLKIAEYIGKSIDFASVEAVADHLKNIYYEFAPMTEEDWMHMAKYSCRRTKAGTWRLKVDNRVGEAFRESISYFNVDMWETWERITCPVLVLRGKNSSFLSEETAEKMLTCGPQTTLVEFDDTGHTPTLRNEEQCDVIAEWLASN